jgi:hypothetical protein
MRYAKSKCAKSITWKRWSIALTLLFLSALSISSLQAQSTHSVSLSWTASTDFVSGDSYNVYRGTVSGGPYTKVNTAAITADTFTDSSVSVGTYYYVATHVSGTAESAFSNEAKAVLLPRAPTTLVATPQ